MNELSWDSALTAFDYQPQTRVVFGPDSVDRLGELARDMGGRRALLVSDPGVVIAGHTERGRRSLLAAGVEPVQFDRVETNPTTNHVEDGLAVAKHGDIDLIVGLGGGSAMDCAKGVNFLLTNGGRMQDYWGVGKAGRPMLPMIAVPTTAGTGSEAQSFALITDPETGTKMACGDKKAACRIAILDPLLTMSQPTEVTVAAGIDAAAHAIESFVTRKRNALSNMFAREAWLQIEPNFEVVLNDPTNLNARAAMLLGAHLAGAAIEQSMLGAAHACANPLTQRFHLVHGLAVGVMLPWVIRWNAPAAGVYYRELASRGTTHEGRYPDDAERLAARVEAMLRAGHVALRLRHYGVSEGDLPGLAQEAAGQWTARFNSRPVNVDALMALYHSAW